MKRADAIVDWGALLLAALATPISIAAVMLLRKPRRPREPAQ